MWREARERMKALANRALDVVEVQLGSGDPKAALAAAKYILQGTRLLGDTELLKSGPTTPEGVVLQNLEREARSELMAQIDTRDPIYYSFQMESIDMKVEELAKTRLKKAMAEAGLS
jgi:hypothetical protein